MVRLILAVIASHSVALRFGFQRQHHGGFRLLLVLSLVALRVKEVLSQVWQVLYFFAFFRQERAGARLVWVGSTKRV